MDGGFLNAAGFQALGADADSSGSPVDIGADPLKIGAPLAPGPIVGMGNVVPELRPFPADLTNFRHSLNPLARWIFTTLVRKLSNRSVSENRHQLPVE